VATDQAGGPNNHNFRQHSGTPLLMAEGYRLPTDWRIVLIPSMIDHVSFVVTFSFNRASCPIVPYRFF
jgi:hypothetical protein